MNTEQIEKLYEEYIHKSRYARYLYDEGRRETWDETVDRYINFFREKNLLPKNRMDELREAIYNKDIMPSMRALMTAGPALERDNIAGYNCAYLTISRVRAFDELMYILMCGTGVGFSVERQYIDLLPEIAEDFHDTDTTIHVRDSKIGWAKALRELIALLYNGHVPKWDTSKVRPEGAPLKIFGGRASGPKYLERLFNTIVEIFKVAKGRKLNSIECHDICCHIASAVVVGGVRRSALISLSNLSDQRMSLAKNGAWYTYSPQRQVANNSVCYTEHPDIPAFMKEMSSMYEGKSGERGIFNRKAAKKKVESIGRRDSSHDFGTNPCSEIILRDRQFCNLTEVIVRPKDDLDTIQWKVDMATILGTLQSTLTNFKYISNKWKENCDEERLLGVSLTGIMDHFIFNTPSKELSVFLEKLKKSAIETNKEIATYIGIPPSAAITCVKPSGTVSQLCNTASGIHARHSKYYIRRVRNDIKDPLSTFLVNSGAIPYEVDSGNPASYVFSFPMRSPNGAKTRNDYSAIEQLELWKVYANHWCEHKPSITVTYKPEEFMDLCAWVYKNMDIMSGVSFLPHSDHVYQQAPYEEITKEEYDSMVSGFKEGAVNFQEFNEEEDHTTASQELACVGGACEI